MKLHDLKASNIDISSEEEDERPYLAPKLNKVYPKNVFFIKKKTYRFDENGVIQLDDKFQDSFKVLINNRSELKSIVKLFGD